MNIKARIAELEAEGQQLIAAANQRQQELVQISQRMNEINGALVELRKLQEPDDEPVEAPASNRAQRRAALKKV